MNIRIHPDLIILGAGDLTEEQKSAWKPASSSPELTPGRGFQNASPSIFRGHQEDYVSESGVETQNLFFLQQHTTPLLPNTESCRAELLTVQALRQRKQVITEGPAATTAAGIDYPGLCREAFQVPSGALTGQ